MVSTCRVRPEGNASATRPEYCRRLQGAGGHRTNASTKSDSCTTEDTLGAIGTTVDDILRFPTSVRHDPAIDAWLAAQRDDLRRFADTWFTRIRQCGGDVRELMHDGCPTACLGDAAFAYVNVFTKH